MNLKNLTLFAFGILVLVLSRLLPHPANWTAAIGLAIYGGYTFKNSGVAALQILIGMLISDWILGFHETMVWVYLPLVLVTLLPKLMPNSKWYSWGISGLSGSLIFFLISNLGVWWTQSLYLKNLTGLLACYVNAVPFFQTQVVGDLFFVSVFFLVSNFQEKAFARQIQS